MWMRSRAALDGGGERGEKNLPDGWGCEWFASSRSKRKHVGILCCSSVSSPACGFGGFVLAPEQSRCWLRISALI